MKKSLRITAFIMMLLMLIAGMEAVPALADAAPKPKSVSISAAKTVQLALGSTLTLTPTLSPENAATTFKWSSSKKKVATVSGGVVTPKKVGTTTITCTTANKKKAKIKVKVIDPYKPSAVGFTVSGTQSLCVMNTLQLTPVLAPDTARTTYKWTSSKKKVAIVDKNGVVSGIMPGTTTITCTTANKKKAKIKVKVYDDGQQPITTQAGYNLPYVIYACKNTHTIAIIARDGDGNWTRVIKLFPTGTGKISSNTDVGTFFIRKKERWHRWGSGYSPYANKLSIGLYLHGPIYKSKNLNTIRPSYYNGIGGNCSSGCLRTTCACSSWVYYNCPVGTQVIIAQNSRFYTPRPAKLGKKAKKDPTDPGTNYEILTTSFGVEPGALSLGVGASAALTAVNQGPANTSTHSFTFSSDNPGVATVSPEGVVTAVGGGAATIYVTAADDYQCTVGVPVTVSGANEAADVTGLAEAAEAAEIAAVEETPVAGEPAVEESIVVEEPVAVESVIETPIIEESVADAPAAGQIAAEEPAAGTEAEDQEAVDGEAEDLFFFGEVEEVPEELSDALIFEE